MPSHPLARLALVACACLALAACGDTHAPQRAIALADCHLPKLAQTLSCGTLDVPEHRGDPQSRKLSIAVAILPANTLSPKPDPLFVLAGGPGQAASSIADFAARLADVRTTRDIVLVDQRGTGRSSPLDCKVFARADDLADVLDVDPVPKARACAAELAARGVDLARYTTDEFIADLEDVRRALGYPKVNLWGGSYGTRVAQEYLRRHPDVVRSVVLDGVAPPSMIVSLDVWTTRERAVDAIVAACGRSTACKAAHPDIASTLDAVHARLGDAGREVALPMPRTGEVRAIRIGFDAFLAALQPIVYQPESAALLPEILARARDGDFAPLMATLSAFDDAMEGDLNAALHYSVTCAEDVPRITPERKRAALEGSRAGGLVGHVLAVCDAWPRGAMPADFATPVTSDVPVLLLSGGLDPVTPPRYAEEVAKTLSHSRSIVAPGFGHIISPRGCVPRLIAKFVDAAGFDTLPASCVDWLAGTSAPLLWPDRLEPKP
jgi:pimeloyl-ACP methyl ester carboxylesterase